MNIQIKTAISMAILAFTLASATGTKKAWATTPCKPDTTGCASPSETTCKCPIINKTGPGWSQTQGVYYAYDKPPTYGPQLCRDCNGYCVKSLHQTVWTDKSCVLMTITSTYDPDKTTPDIDAHAVYCGQKISINYLGPCPTQP